MPVAPEAVWDTLADPQSYAHWVVGSKVVRDADPGFPAVGTRFHHTIGIGPLELHDHTEILDADRPRLMRMRAKGRPFGTATVTLEMTAQDGGTLVRMVENPDGPALLTRNPLLQVLTRLRNTKSLERLERLARGR